MKYRLLLFLFISSLSFTSSAQVTSGDPHFVKFRMESQKDPAYIRFLAELNKLINSSTGPDFNSIALKKLFDDNKLVLQKLHDRSGIPRSVTRFTVDNKKKHTIPGNANFTLAKQLKPSDQPSVQENPPFKHLWRRIDLPVKNSTFPFDTSTNIKQGSIAITSNPCYDLYNCHIGNYMAGVGESITIPNDPLLLAVRIGMEYSFDYDGWDSYGAGWSINLVFRTSSNFNSPAFNQLDDAPYSDDRPDDRWKIAENLMPWTSVGSDYEEFHTTVNSSVTVEGFVVPGSTIDLHLGLGFLPSSNKGLTGCYHYGVFQLKRITITYLKNGD